MNEKKAKALRRQARLRSAGEPKTTYMRHPQNQGSIVVHPKCTRWVYRQLKRAAHGRTFSLLTRKRAKVTHLTKADRDDLSKEARRVLWCDRRQKTHHRLPGRRAVRAGCRRREGGRPQRVQLRV